MQLLKNIVSMGATRAQIHSVSALILEQLRRASDSGEVSPPAVAAAKSMIQAASLPATLPAPEIDADLEELDITWRMNGKLVKMITYPAQTPKVYWQVDAEDPFTRGHLKDAVDASVLNETLGWLLS